MESRVSDSLMRQRFDITLLTGLAGLALVLAVIGILSVKSFLVACGCRRSVSGRHWEHIVEMY
jgi:hypothetical protein